MERLRARREASMKRDEEAVAKLSKDLDDRVRKANHTNEADSW
jgi:hypothetical protein